MDTAISASSSKFAFDVDYEKDVLQQFSPPPSFLFFSPGSGQEKASFLVLPFSIQPPSGWHARQTGVWHYDLLGAQGDFKYEKCFVKMQVKVFYNLTS